MADVMPDRQGHAQFVSVRAARGLVPAHDHREGTPLLPGDVVVLVFWWLHGGFMLVLLEMLLVFWCLAVEPS